MVSATKLEACTNYCGCPENGGRSLKGFAEETSEQRIKDGNELSSGKGYIRQNKAHTQRTNVRRMQSWEQGVKCQKIRPKR